MTVEVKSFDIMSVAKIYGVIGAIVGFIAGIIFAATVSVTTAGIPFVGSMGATFGVLAIIVMPIIYGVGGFIGGLIGAVIYNIIAGRVGGIKFESS